MKIPVLVIAVLMMLGIAYAATVKPNPTLDSPSKAEAEDIPTIPEESGNAAGGTVLANSANYVEYTEGILKETVTDKQILFFYANWCPTCKAAQEDIQANLSSLPEAVTIVRVNYNDPQTDDAEKALAKKYDITYQHTFVQIDSEGNELVKWNGGGVEDIKANLK